MNLPYTFLIATLATLTLTSSGRAADPDYVFPRPAVMPEPRTYVCRRADAVSVDGVPDEGSWEAAEWTETFVDIEGGPAAPHLATTAAMLWDDDFLYVAARLEEPHVWASLTERDAVIYHDDDFEVFIDPDGDTHEYYELEINALGTVWDLLLTKPYRDDGTAIDSWDVAGLLSAVHVDGTVNDPSDIDRGWTVEIALPWSVLEECAHRPAPPDVGNRWRVNFSRVDWSVAHDDGRYFKLEDEATGRPLPESNWVWSPQGLIAMHYPEMWGVVLFSDEQAEARGEAVPGSPGDAAARELFRIYYAQRTHHGRTGSYAADVETLGLAGPSEPGTVWPPGMWVTPVSFVATVKLEDGTALTISEDGHLR